MQEHEVLLPAGRPGQSVGPLAVRSRVDEDSQRSKRRETKDDNRILGGRALWVTRLPNPASAVGKGRCGEFLHGGIPHYSSARDGSEGAASTSGSRMDDHSLGRWWYCMVGRRPAVSQRCFPLEFW